jgi:3-hexulose-6-phosphate synthase
MNNTNVIKTKLQVALDFADEKKAFSIAKKVCKYAEIIELGTPLIKNCGAKNITKKMKKLCKNSKIFSDLKTMDTGAFEAEIAIKNGANYVTILGVSDIDTIKGAIKKVGKENVVIDLIGCNNVTKRIHELMKVGAKNFEIHTGIDQQNKGMTPFKNLSNAKKIKGIKIWVAGGIKLETINQVIKYSPEVVVVGGAITKAKNPEKEAEQIKNKISEAER